MAMGPPRVLIPSGRGTSLLLGFYGGKGGERLKQHPMSLLPEFPRPPKLCSKQSMRHCSPKPPEILANL